MINSLLFYIQGPSQVVLVVKNLSANAGHVRDVGSIPGSGRFPGGGHGNPLQYSCLENLMDRAVWQATVHSVVKSRTQLKQLGMHVCMQSIFNFLRNHQTAFHNSCTILHFNHHCMSVSPSPHPQKNLFSGFQSPVIFVSMTQ